MIFSLILLVSLATINDGKITKKDWLRDMNEIKSKKADEPSPKAHIECYRYYSKIGCFKQSSSPNLQLLINDQDPKSDHFHGYMTDMSNFTKSTHSLACRCAHEAMIRGYTYFSIRFWGLCYAGRDYKNVEEMVDDKSTHSSPNCANPKYQACEQSHAHECVGWANADYIYGIYDSDTTDPNVDGGYGAWSEWTNCSADCDYGVEQRERTCTNPVPKGHGKNCDELGAGSETRVCKLRECKVDGGWTAWEKYSTCTRSCGGGVSRRFRYCKNPEPRNGGSYCPGEQMETKRCSVNACPIHGGYTQWSRYGPCTATCGIGEKTRTRQCTDPAPANGGRTCAGLGDAEEVSSCNDGPCPIDGGYANWTPFSRCTRSCGSGRRMRFRMCTNPPAQYGGSTCVGPFVENENCNTDPCPVDGGWGAYSEWAACPVSCGGGVTRHRRSCTEPSPAFGGNFCGGPASETKACNTQECPIPGGYTEWSEFDECTVSCAGGTKLRTRTCTNPEPQFGGANCTGPTTDSEVCNSNPCPIDGGLSDYGRWSICTKPCGGGSQLRTRSCTNPAPQYGGDDCIGALREFRDCNTQACARYGRYGQWSRCSKTCGGGAQKRSRSCFAAGVQKQKVDCAHLGSHTETRSCETQNCPIDGVWGAWTEWTECTRTCGQGSRRKNRVCNNPEPQFGGRGCPGYRYIIQHCNINPCPITGGWTVWSGWQSCSKSCGGGVRAKNRQCSNPRPQHGGAVCEGENRKSQRCNIQNCPVDGEWTSWTTWKACPVSCGGGRTDRSRTCTNPTPQYGGEMCAGVARDVKECGTLPCPIPGEWSAFTAFGECSKSCGGGSQVSVRRCDDPAPLYDGRDCSGNGQRSRACNTDPCPVDGRYSEWSAFSTCSVPCGRGGVQERTRTCTPPQHGGRECDVRGPAVDTRECNTHVCPVQSYHTAHGCFYRSALATCAEGEGKIHVLSAQFGRWKKNVCGDFSMFPMGCKSPVGKATEVVTPLCEDKVQCAVPSIPNMFDDPCGRSPAFLEIMYQCYGGRYPAEDTEE